MSKELEERKMNVVAPQETRRPLTRKMNTKGYIIYYNGYDNYIYHCRPDFAVRRKLSSYVF